MTFSTRLETLAERLRRNLFVIPGLCLVFGAAAAEAIVRLDRAGVGGWLPSSYETTADDARAVLSAIAAGTITVVTLVLTLTLVAIQLAAGQLSPRTIVNFLGDRFQQVTVGVVLGTATLSLFGLRSLRVGADSDLEAPDLLVLTAVLAIVASLVMLVMSVDRTASRLAVGQIVRDIAQETCDLVERRYGGKAELSVAVGQPAQAHLLPEAASTNESGRSPAAKSSKHVNAASSGWVQYIDDDALVSALPDDSDLELLRPVGTFVLSGMQLVQVRAVDGVDDKCLDAIERSIVIGDSRTMQQDIGFGFTRLTDIGLRALSPGVNDPNTAREVVLRASEIVLALQRYKMAPPVVEFERRRVVRRRSPTHDDFARDAFDQLRLAAADDAWVLRTLDTALATIVAETKRHGLPGRTKELERQHALVLARLNDLVDVGPSDDDADGPPRLP